MSDKRTEFLGKIKGGISIWDDHGKTYASITKIDFELTELERKWFIDLFMKPKRTECWVGADEEGVKYLSHAVFQRSWPEEVPDNGKPCSNCDGTGIGKTGHIHLDQRHPCGTIIPDPCLKCGGSGIETEKQEGETE
jgi:hypothetical protein